MGIADDYLASPPEEEYASKSLGRQLSGFGAGLMNPLGISGWALKQAAPYVGHLPYVPNEAQADLFDRRTKEMMRAAPIASGIGAGVPLGATLGPAAIMARFGGMLPLSYLAGEALPAVPMGMGVGGGIGRFLEPYEPPDAQAMYRRGGS